MKENAIQTAQSAQVSKKPITMQDYIKKMQGEIAKALPSVLTPERFTRICLPQRRLRCEAAHGCIGAYRAVKFEISFAISFAI